MEQTNPFRQQYGFAPSNPVFFSEELRKLYEKWKSPTPLNLFYGKTAFYRFVYEIYKELEQGQIRIFEPDVVTMAQQYLNEHYREAISIQDMCHILGISYSHFHRRFKQQTGKSPQDYLIHTRLSAAKKLLNGNEVTVREVGEYCGFQDERNFQRLFLKHTGLSPNAYRENTPLHMRGETVGSLIPFPYNKQGQVSLDQPSGKGATYMFKQMRNKTIIAAALSLMLLMSACDTAPPASSEASSLPTSAVTSQTSQTEETRIVKTDSGDVIVPAKPQKVVGINCYNILKSLDENAVNMDEREELSYFTDSYDWEGLMALEPDLIIASYFQGSEEYIKQCEQIAATVTFDDNATIEEKQLFIGQALGKQEEAEVQIADYQNFLEDSIQQLKNAGIYGSKVAILQYTSSGAMYAYGDKLGRGGDILFHLLGFKATDIVQTQIIDGDDPYLELSMETLADYADVDYIILMQRDESVEKLYENGVWKSLKPVQEGHYFSITTEEYNSLFNSPSIVEVQKSIELYLERFQETSK
ncbi:helix-turn-helix domain-containing protein [Scatolibacter rhodanostii]|uniref:helix-turn-helix domain-containing protein n=1 Tax=Scatolibacter rhodanostii TaxID=2014781 RepID=UPI001356468D|nr:helix-turn-helix domain-containing protein [Scatolibacter rhodanostii]